MEKRYEISDDGSIFYIGDDGTIHRVGKINGEGNIEGKTKSNVNGVLWFFLFVAVIISIVLLRVNLNLSSAEDELRNVAGNLELQISNLKSENEYLDKQNWILTSAFPFRIDRIEIGNTDGKGNIIDDYGSNLNAKGMRYLTPKIYYTGFVDRKSVTIKYKIFESNGIFKYIYPYIYLGGGDFRTIYRGSNTVTLSGWGTPVSFYLKGTYRIEIWCNEVCFGTKDFSMD